MCCFAYHFGVTYDQLISMLGHDGRTAHSGTDQQRGFHVQEFVEVGLHRGIAVVIIDAEYLFDLSGYPPQAYSSVCSLRHYLGHHSGVLEVAGDAANHALIWDHQKQAVSDPREPGWQPLRADVDIISFYVVTGFHP